MENQNKSFFNCFLLFFFNSLNAMNHCKPETNSIKNFNSKNTIAIAQITQFGKYRQKKSEGNYLYSEVSILWLSCTVEFEFQQDRTVMKMIVCLPYMAGGELTCAVCSHWDRSKSKHSHEKKRRLNSSWYGNYIVQNCESIQLISFSEQQKNGGEDENIETGRLKYRKWEWGKKEVDLFYRLAFRNT